MVFGLQLEDSLHSIKTRREQFIVGMVLRYDILELVLLLHQIGCCYVSVLQIMNFQDDNYQLWKSKLALAQDGDPSILNELKSHLTTSQPQHLLLTTNFKTLLADCKLFVLQKQQCFGGYQLYSKIPSFLLLSGQAGIQCINMEGDNELITKLDRPGVLQISQSQLKSKYGENNITLLTQFEIVAVQKSVVVELSPKSTLSALKTLDQNKISLKEEIIMRKYMLIALKHVTKLSYTKGTAVNQKFYLLQGRVCYYHNKTKNILVCYEEGYFNPQQFSNSNDIKLYIFQGSHLMILQSQMLKDQVATGVQSKRQEHIGNIIKNYLKISIQQSNKLQSKLIAKYKLNKKEVDRQILGIADKPATQKLNKTKTDLTTTNTSMKDSIRDKCGIRIRKTRKN